MSGSTHRAYQRLADWGARTLNRFRHPPLVRCAVARRVVDGLAFGRAARRMLPEAPIIDATGRIDPKQRDDFRALGVDQFLIKPFTEGEFAATLTAVLRSPRSRGTAVRPWQNPFRIGRKSNYRRPQQRRAPPISVAVLR